MTKETGKQSGKRGSRAALCATYERIARFYDLVDLPFEHGRYRHLRPRLFEGLGGRILDAGVGTGRNMAYYPRGSDVVGIDQSAAMLRRAARRCRRSPATVRLREMDVTRLDFPDASFDGAVASFLFCTLPEDEQPAALRELARVLKPGGLLRLLDYTRPEKRVRRLLTRLWEPWARWAFGARFDSRPEQHFAGAGLKMVGRAFLVEDLILLVEACRDERAAERRADSAAGRDIPTGLTQGELLS